MDKMVQKPNYVEELLEILRGSLAADELQDQISDYHESDIADAFEQLTEEERRRLYPLLGPEWIAEIFTYIEDPDEYLKELDLGQAAQVLSYMDSDDAVDVLDELDDTTQEKLVGMMDEESSHDIKMLQSYEDDEVGSLMTTNFIVIHENLTIRQAMRELIRQAGENDNISTVYVIDKNDQFYGAIDLKDLIIAREKDALEDIISTSYPYVTDHEKIDDCIEQIKDYAEDSIPVLTEDKQLIGVITAQDLVEVVDDAMGEDYAKLAGLTAEEDLEETTTESMKKRLPWLVILLYIWLLKGNPVVHAFVISGCVGFSLMAAMVISSLVGTLIPMFFHKIKIDPAVASGPLITTVNDLVAVVIYYGLVWILLIHFLHMV